MKLALPLLAATALCCAATAAASAATPTTRFSLEAGATANLAARSIVSDSPVGALRVHTMGLDLTGVYATRSPRHAFTLRLSYASGEADDSALLGTQVYEMEGKLTTLTLMPGYRYTTRLSTRTHLFVGANAGIAMYRAQDRESLDGHTWVNVSARDYGAAASAEIGLEYARSERLSFFAAYRVSAATARPELEWSDGESSYSAKLNAQLYHSLSAGVRWRF